SIRADRRRSGRRATADQHPARRRRGPRQRSGVSARRRAQAVRVHTRAGRQRGVRRRRGRPRGVVGVPGGTGAGMVRAGTGPARRPRPTQPSMLRGDGGDLSPAAHSDGATTGPGVAGPDQSAVLGEGPRGGHGTCGRHTVTAPCAQPRARGGDPTEAHVVVAGSGLAGLTAACDLADAGVSVTLLESRARLGGATFSFQRGGMTVDNGQHVVLRCCTAYLRLLERLGSSAGMAVQERFRVPVLAPGGRFTELRRIDVPAPLHLLPAIARYRALRPIDRARVLRAALALRSLDPDDESLDSHNFGDWLARHGQNDETRDRLWNLITVAALNGHVSQVSLASAAKVFRTALLDAPDAADIGIPRWPLEDLHVRPAEKYLIERGGRVRTHSPVRGVTPVRDRFLVRLDDEVLEADAVVLAVPPETAARVCPERAGLQRWRLVRLGAVPIVNVHV